MLSTSYLEIDKSALAHNLDFIKKNLVKSAVLSCVIKGNAYGHGIEKMAPLLEDLGITHLSVFSTLEAMRAKAATKNCQIMVMGGVSDEDLKWAINDEIEFYVFDLEKLKTITEVSKELHKKARVHLEVETGMNRLGFSKESFLEAIKYSLDENNYIEVVGVSTHLAGAESHSNFLRVKKQIEIFNEIKEISINSGLLNAKFHLACSAAIVRFPETEMGMVRVGIMTYGFWSNQETMISFLERNKLTKNPLKRVLSWKSKVISLKEVKKGEYVGYGTSFLASENKKIAVVPVGYANGFSRNLSNSGRVLVAGKRASVAGTVNMNLVSVDVTHIPDVKVNDEVVLIGFQKDQEITVASFGDYSDLLNYEVLTRLPDDIPRFIK